MRAQFYDICPGARVRPLDRTKNVLMKSSRTLTKKLNPDLYNEEQSYWDETIKSRICLMEKRRNRTNKEKHVFVLNHACYVTFGFPDNSIRPQNGFGILHPEFTSELDDDPFLQPESRK